MKRVMLVVLTLVVAYFTPGQADARHKASWAVSQCLECHPRAKPTHKPVVAGKMQADLPLDEQGRIICITCHECVSGTCTIPRDKAELCRVCHDCKRGMACSLDISHIGDSKNIRYWGTLRCMECHGKTLGLEICRLGRKTLDVQFHQSDKSSLRQSPDEEVVLVEGKVACISCHDPFTTRRGRLFVSNRESSACLTCHKSLEKVDHSRYKGIRVCLNCHPRAWPTHKQETVVSADKNLPLDDRGKMSCMTCHNCLSGTCLLRLKKVDLCATCHDCNVGMACALGSVHLGSESKDIMEESCLGCHDDTAAQACEIDDLPDSPGKRVACTLCHDPYSSRQAKLKKGKNTETILRMTASRREDSQGAPTCIDCHPDKANAFKRHLKLMGVDKDGQGTSEE